MQPISDDILKQFFDAVLEQTKQHCVYSIENSMIQNNGQYNRDENYCVEQQTEGEVQLRIGRRFYAVLILVDLENILVVCVRMYVEPGAAIYLWAFVGKMRSRRQCRTARGQQQEYQQGGD
jgi:hypothetical protein